MPLNFLIHIKDMISNINTFRFTMNNKWIQVAKEFCWLHEHNNYIPKSNKHEQE